MSTAKKIEKALVKARLGELIELDEEPTEEAAIATATFARPDDPDPPPFDVKGTPTIRNKIDDLMYYPQRRRKRCKEHDWQPHPYYALLRQCAKCRRTRPRKRCKLTKLLPIFKERLFPPTDKLGRYHELCIINKKLMLKRSWTSATAGEWVFVDFVLFVKFPKGWLWTGHFTEFQFDRLIRAVDPLLDEAVPYDPQAVYNAAQTAIFGKSWGGTGGLNLERLM